MKHLFRHHATSFETVQVSLRATGVLVAFDPDQAGRRAAIKAYHLLSSLTDTVLIVTLPSGQDPAQILHDRGATALAVALAEQSRPLADLVIDAEVDRWSRWLVYAEGRINALHAAAPVIARMPPAHVARQVARLARRLDLDYPTVTEAVTDALSDARAGPPHLTESPQEGTAGQLSRAAHAAGQDSLPIARPETLPVSSVSPPVPSSQPRPERVEPHPDKLAAASLANKTGRCGRLVPDTTRSGPPWGRRDPCGDRRQVRTMAATESEHSPGTSAARLALPTMRF